VEDDRGREKERYPVVPGAKIKVKEGARVASGKLLVEWDPFTTPILTEVSGAVVFPTSSTTSRSASRSMR